MLKQTITYCPICNGITALSFIAKDSNRRITQENFRYYSCPNCSLTFLNPIPVDLDRYYSTEYYETPASLEKLEKDAATEFYKIELVKRFTKNGRILDIGAGYGRFVYLAHKEGFEVDAIEVSKECCNFITSVIGINAIEHAQPEVAMTNLEPYDIITFWHVAEHLSDPWIALKTAVQKLKIGGFLIVAMPNPDSFQFRVFKKYWAHLDAPRHLHLVPLHLLVRELTKDGRMKFVESSTVDQGSLNYNYLGWTWSMRNAIRIRGAWRFGRQIARLLLRFEQVGMRGSCYTAVFQKKE